MAVPPNSNDAFLREVDEELRRDQLAGFWERWGLWLVGAIVLALAAYGGFLFWQHRNAQAAGVEGEQLQAAYDSLAADNAGAAQASLDALATSKRDGYRTLARFAQADVQLRKNDLKGAAATFAGIAQDGSLAQPFRDLALVRQTSAEYDGLKPQVVVERLRTLAAPGSPWFASAGEMVAIAYLRTNRRDLAGTLFGQIARDANTPDSLRQRAVQMAGVLGVDAVAQGAQNEEHKAQ